MAWHRGNLPQHECHDVMRHQHERALAARQYDDYRIELDSSAQRAAFYASLIFSHSTKIRGLLG